MIYHIASSKDLDQMRTQGYYSVESLQTEGFIHCSTAEQVHEVGKRYFAGRKDVWLLHINEKELQHKLRYENATNNEVFPHLYGLLPTADILKIEKVEY